PYPPTECCFDFLKNPLRFNVLKDFYETSNDCSFPAIVFETKNRAKICAEPNMPWVQRSVAKLQKMK
ncbi:CCL4 protein, partial [Alectura lathami]|nr:CCL4 protein [Alectura lathami]